MSAFADLMGRWRKLRGERHVAFVWRPEHEGTADEWHASTAGDPHLYVGRSGEEALRALVTDHEGQVAHGR